MAAFFKVDPDEERAKSLSRQSALRVQAAKALDKSIFATLIIEQYYEATIQLVQALMAKEGRKGESGESHHVVFIEYLKQHHHKEFSESQRDSMDRLRKLRNDIVYDGSVVTPELLERRLPSNKSRL